MYEYMLIKNNKLKEDKVHLDNELITHQKMLEDIQSQLYDTQENLKEEVIKNTSLNEELNKANTVIDALNGETYTMTHTITDKEINMIAQTIWGEARGLSTIEQSMVVWCILNRVDDGYWGDSVAEVITYPNQFHGYHKSYPIEEEFVALARDVVTRWQMEKYCTGNIGRTLPSKYLYFNAKNGHNVFKTNYKQPYESYDWSNCFNPYE